MINKIEMGFSKMKVFNTILGIFAILGAIYCICWPGITFLTSNMIAMILLGSWGICAIFSYVVSPYKKTGSTTKNIVMGILAVLAAIFIAIAIFSPLMRAFVDIAIIYTFTVWMIISGISDIILAISTRKANTLWVLSLILGVFVVIGGMYGLFHAVFTAQVIGMLLGIALMVYGVKLVASAFEKE